MITPDPVRGARNRIANLLCIGMALAGCSGERPIEPRARLNQIAFASQRDGNWDIYAMDTTGSAVIRLTSDRHTDFWPSWSPDGRRIAFASDRDSIPGRPRGDHVYVMNADGSAQRRLVAGDEGSRAPAWSPDGKRIAYDCYRSQRVRICLNNPEGTAEVVLTPGEFDSFSAAWAPDGSRIAFVSNRSPTRFAAIYVIDLGELEVRMLAPGLDGSNCMTPAWAPDGQSIAFAKNIFAPGGFNAELFVARSDGSDLRRLTDNRVDDVGPVWSPDGARLAYFAQNGAQSFDVFVMDLGTGQVANLTNHPGDDRLPRWGPRR